MNERSIKTIVCFTIEKLYLNHPNMLKKAHITMCAMLKRNENCLTIKVVRKKPK